MSYAFRICLLSSVAVAGIAQTAKAQYIQRPAVGECGPYRLPHQLRTCTTLKPVVETRYRQEQTLSYRDQRQTVIRHEPELEFEPATTYRKVVVDEGSYQTVWVPKKVVRTVAETVYEPRVSYRPVAYGVTHRVPQLTTRLVPEQTVRYVPERTTVAVGPLAPIPCDRLTALWGDDDAAWMAGLPRHRCSASAQLRRRYGDSSSSDSWYDDNPSIRITTASSVKSPTAATVWQTRR